MMFRSTLRSAIVAHQSKRLISVSPVMGVAMSRPVLDRHHKGDKDKHMDSSASHSSPESPVGLGDQKSRKDPSMARAGEDDINDRVRNAPTLQFDDAKNRLNEARPSGEQTRQWVPGGAAQAAQAQSEGVTDKPAWERKLEHMPDLNAKDQDQSRRSNADIKSESISGTANTSARSEKPSWEKNMEKNTGMNMEEISRRSDECLPSQGGKLRDSGNTDFKASGIDPSKVHKSAGGTSTSSESHGAPGTEFTESYRPGIDQARGSDYQGQAMNYDKRENIQAKQHDSGMSQQSQQMSMRERMRERSVDQEAPIAGMRSESRADINRQVFEKEPRKNPMSSMNSSNPISHAAETISQAIDPVLKQGKEVIDSIRDTVKNILDPDHSADRRDRDQRDRRDRNDEFSNRSDRSGRNNN